MGAAVLSAKDPDIPALVAFLRDRYPVSAPHLPIGTAGKAFPLLGRDKAVAMLADHVASRLVKYECGQATDQKLHKVAVAAAGPGTGKTRLLWDSLEQLQRHCGGGDATRFPELAQVLASGLRLFVTYGNGSPPLDEELKLETAAGGFAARLLHAHFGPENVEFQTFSLALARDWFGLDQHGLFHQLGLGSALQAIALDVARAPSHGFDARYLFMVVALDEFTSIGMNLLQRITEAMKMKMSMPERSADGRIVFIQPILGGTSLTIATTSISESGMLALPLAVPPLEITDVLTILEHPGIIPASRQFLLRDQTFLELLADISGHPRSLDYLVGQMLEIDIEENTPQKIGNRLRDKVIDMLKNAYHQVGNLSVDNQRLIPAIKVAILGDSVIPEVYDVEERGGLVLRVNDGTGVTARTRLHVPLLFLEVWGVYWRSDPAFASVKHLFADGLNLNLAHTDTWQHFEIEVFRIEALRLACTAGTRRPLADLLRGALGNVNSIARWKTTVEPGDPTVVLPNRLPFGSSIKVPYDRVVGAHDSIASSWLNSDVEGPVDVCRILMGLNAVAAAFDQFSARIVDSSGQQGILCMQSKHTCQLEGEALTLEQIRAEYRKIAEAMTDERLRAHFGCKTAAHVPFVVLLHTVKPLARDVTAAALPPRCFVVGRAQFADYFGSIFGARIEMVARATGARSAS